MILKSIIIAGTCSLFAFVVHLMLNLLRPGRNKDESMILELQRQRKLLVTIWSLTALLYAWLFFMPVNSKDILVTNFVISDWIIDFFYGIVLYLLLSLIYLTFYYFINRSISATLLEIINLSLNKKLTLDEIKKIYNIEKKYESEIKGMQQGGFITLAKGYYKNTLKGVLYGKLASFIKNMLKLGQGG
ncbi:MAG: hypothetical protein NT014_06295 [Candidatus Omnitrophica bacterium]|nr:hypothetical protein [Candidatus Omnitrophota bacterium]